MEQISVKKLEEVLVVAGDDKQKQKEFYELLLSTEFYVAGSLGSRGRGNRRNTSFASFPRRR